MRAARSRRSCAPTLRGRTPAAGTAASRTRRLRLARPPRRLRRACRRRRGTTRGARHGRVWGSTRGRRPRSPTTWTFSARDGRELAPELVERVAVEPARARLELRRIDQVRRSDLRDVHLEPGCSRTSTPAAPAWSRWMCERSRCRDVGELEPALGEPGLQVLDAGRRAAVEERGAVLRLERGSSR